MGTAGASSNENYNGSVNNMMAINLGGNIQVDGSIGNADVTQNGSSSATGGGMNFGVTANMGSGMQMPGLMLQELCCDCSYPEKGGWLVVPCNGVAVFHANKW